MQQTVLCGLRKNVNRPSAIIHRKQFSVNLDKMLTMPVKSRRKQFCVNSGEILIFSVTSQGRQFCADLDEMFIMLVTLFTEISSV